MAESGRLRIGDAERAAAAEELGEHYAQGRLTAEEHQERLDQVMAARTAAELAPPFADLPGSPYRPPAATSYATAGRPGVGSERPRPFAGPPFGRPPFSPYAGTGRGRAARGWSRGLPFPLKALLVLIIAAVVLTHLPLILIGLVVWFVVARFYRARSGGQPRHWSHSGC